MPEHRLLENTFAGSSVDCPLGGLFHGPAFFKLHSAGTGVFFEWEQNGKVVACIHFTPSIDGLWRSPARGTFAGFACAQGLRLESLWAFEEAVQARLAVLGATQIEILPAPMAHDPVAFANQFYLLRTRGYEMTRCDLNHSLQVDTRGLGERMSYGNLKRLRKCEREGLVAEQLPLNTLAAVYDTLAANRTINGHVMSMTLAQLQTMADSFPDAMVLFGVSDGDRLAAGGLCLHLGAGVLYVFYWGDRPGYSSLSPVVCVAEAIYRYCQQKGLRLLDVGTSTVDGEPNHGLIEFKRGMGFDESLKVCMTRVV
jgi:hypothetical protein